MDSFNSQNIKNEKANAKVGYYRLQKVTFLFRLIELCVFLVILSRFSTFLPVAFKFSREHFRIFFLSLISPRFVFILGNLIVTILFLKSGNSSTRDQNSTNNKNDFYDEYVERCTQRNIHTNQESKKQKQQRISPGKALIGGYKEKILNRSSSENLKSSLGDDNEPRRVLRRTVTERCPESVQKGDTTAGTSTTTSYPVAVDEMSNDEFRSRVEAFIAKQQKLIKEDNKLVEDFSSSLDLVKI